MKNGVGPMLGPNADGYEMVPGYVRDKKCHVCGRLLEDHSISQLDRCEAIYEGRV